MGVGEVLDLPPEDEKGWKKWLFGFSVRICKSVQSVYRAPLNPKEPKKFLHGTIR